MDVYLFCEKLRERERERESKNRAKILLLTFCHLKFGIIKLRFFYFIVNT